MKHKRVIKQWYEIDFNTSHRHLGSKIDDFLSGSPEIETEIWEDNHTILRDFEGDFAGVHIYHTNNTKDLIRFICNKIEINYEDIKGLDFKLVG